MSKEELHTVKDALNEYFRLKEKFENENKVIKKKIINNPTLSKKEKRAEFLKLKPKCVNCKRPSKLGTIFSITFHKEDDKYDAYRTFKTSCGDLADPCNLNIEINIGNVESLDKLMIDIRNTINEIKYEIINDKNKLLFGLITPETAIEKFDQNKDYINSITSLYENYLDKWNEIVDNQRKKEELEEAQVQSYEFINQIKECIKKMNENNDAQFAVDAANIYHNILHPLLQKIRQLKYGENLVYNDDSSDSCKLIQNKYNINDILISGYENKLIAYDVGLKVKTIQKKKSLFVLESSDENREEEEQDKGPITINIKDNLDLKNQEKPKNIPPENPIIGKGEDGIEWENPYYQSLWKSLPPKLKDIFKLNIDWMKEFMHKCVNNKLNPPPGHNGCKLTTPPNIVIPPREANGQYDFGVSIYNTVFNKLPKSLQNTYLTFYREDPTTKQKNYSQLESAMNDLVEKEVGFGRGFF